MDYRKIFEEKIKSSAWDDETHRLIYAEWLDEQGEYEEAERQRQYVPSRKWLRDFAYDHKGDFPHWDGWGDEEDGPTNSFNHLMDFLVKHVTEDFYLAWDTPYDFNDYSDELWKHFEIVTGMKSPQNQYRRERPPFRCAC